MCRCAENTAEKLNISKDDQDDYGILSYRWHMSTEMYNIVTNNIFFYLE